MDTPTTNGASTSDRLSAPAVEELVQARGRDDARVFELLSRLETEGAKGRDDRIVQELADELRANLEERQVAEEELRATSRQLEQTFQTLLEQRRRDRELFEHAPVAYIVTDRNGMIRDCNYLAARWLGDAADTVVGRPLASSVVEEHRRSLRRWLNALDRSGSIDSGSFRLHTSTGATMDVHVSVSVVRNEQDQVTALRWVMVRTTPAEHATWSGPAPVRADVPLRAAIVHTDDLYVHGLRTLLIASFGVEVRVTTRATTEQIEELLEDDPHVLLLGVEGDDLSVLEQVRRDHPSLAVLAIVGDGRDTQLAALAAGADSVLPASTTPTELLGPLLGTAQRWVTVPRALAVEVLGQALQRHRALRGLSDEERVLLRRISAGATTSDVAGELHLSPRTVKRRLASLYRKLGMQTRAEAIALAGVGRPGGAGTPSSRDD